VHGIVQVTPNSKIIRYRKSSFAGPRQSKRSVPLRIEVTYRSIIPSGEGTPFGTQTFGASSGT
jgi:hypothetical protein